MIEQGDRPPRSSDHIAIGSWDQRLTRRLAQDSWVAANRPWERPREPPLRERIRSRWFWLSLLPLAVLIVVRLGADAHGWVSAALWIAYFWAVWLPPMLGRRMRRASLPSRLGSPS